MTKIKSKLLVVLVALLTLSLALGFAFSAPKANANESQGTVNVDTILMDEGASIRFVKQNADPEDQTANFTGIRFTMYINEAWASEKTDVEFGMYIYPVDLLQDGESMTDIEKMPSTALHYVAKDFAGDSAETVQTTKSFNAVVKNIKPEDYNTQLIASGYYKIGNEAPVFASNVQIRSIAQVASMLNVMDIAGGDEVVKAELDAYIDPVVTEDNFKFENLTVKTDFTQTAEPSVGATLPKNLVAIWSSTDTDVATVDANGNITRGTKFGTTTISATLGTKTISSTLTHSGFVIKNPNMPGAVEMSETEWKADGITGDYTGKALKFVQQGSNSAFNYYNPYSIEELNSLKSQYNRISLYFAFNHTDTNGTIYLFHTGFKGKANSATSVYSISKGNIGVWQKFTISIDDYISLLKEDGTYFYPWGDNVDSSGNLWGDNFAATSKMDYYFGELELSYEEPAVLKINESNYSSIANPDAGVSTFISAETLATLGIAGDYTGNATRITVKEAALTNPGYVLTTSYTAQQLTELKSQYTHITTHIAFTGILTSSLNINTTITNQMLLMSKNNGFDNGGFGPNPKWQKVSVTIDQFISLLNNGTVRIIATAHWSGATYAAERYMYIGDFVFENIQA